MVLQGAITKRLPSNPLYCKLFSFSNWRSGSPAAGYRGNCVVTFTGVTWRRMLFLGLSGWGDKRHHKEISPRWQLAHQSNYLSLFHL